METKEVINPQKRNGGIRMFFIIFTLIIFSLVFYVQAQTAAVIDLTPTVQDYYLEVARGNINGVSAVVKFGSNEEVGTTEEDIWEFGGVYNWLDKAIYLQFSSSDVDDSPGGTGARTIIIYGLDENWTKQSETIILNGQTIVNSTNTYRRIYRMVAIEVGSSGNPEGIIYSYAGTQTAGVPDNDLQVYAIINDGEGQTLMAVYTTAADEEVYALQGYISAAGGKFITGRFYFRGNDGVALSKNVRWEGQIKDDSFIYKYSVPLGPIPPKTDMWVAAVGDQGTTLVSAGFDLVEVQT